MTNDDADASPLASGTIKYLSDLAEGSYKRQAELDESIWRSLPFLTTTFAVITALIGRAGTDLPLWTRSVYAITVHFLLTAAVASMGYALSWIVRMLLPREYEFPASDEAVLQYAEQMTVFYAAEGLKSEELDEKVEDELRLFMIDQYGKGASSNLRQNVGKLNERGQALQFMLLGFLLAFACEATIFVHDRAFGSSKVEQGKADVRLTVYTGPKDAPSTDSAEATQGTARDRGSVPLAGQFRSENPEQEMSGSRTPVTPPKTDGSSPKKPTAPAHQVVMKDQAINNSSGKPRGQADLKRKD